MILKFADERRFASRRKLFKVDSIFPLSFNSRTMTNANRTLFFDNLHRKNINEQRGGSRREIVQPAKKRRLHGFSRRIRFRVLPRKTLANSEDSWPGAVGPTIIARARAWTIQRCSNRVPIIFRRGRCWRERVQQRGRGRGQTSGFQRELQLVRARELVLGKYYLLTKSTLHLYNAQCRRSDGRLEIRYVRSVYRSRRRHSVS